jgi:hypothetical protein
MSIGTLAGMVITLFGAIAGAALAGVAAGMFAATSQWELWTAFLLCFGGGALMSMWLSPNPAGLLKGSGMYALLLGLACGGAALAGAVGIFAAAGSRASLWALFALCVPAGLVLFYCGNALPATRDPG